MRVRLGFWAAAAVLAVLPASAALAAPIKMATGVYGTFATNRTCNATQALSVCNGRPSCDIYIGNQLCGDPDYLVVKQIAIKYRCGRTLWGVTVSEYATARLACR